MDFKLIIKKLTYISLLAALICESNVALAEMLSFKAGDKASYTIDEKIQSQSQVTIGSMHSQSQATIEMHSQSQMTIDFDIEILSSNQETASYSFDVGVTLKKILISAMHQSGKTFINLVYDSDYDISRYLENPILAKNPDKLINYPLHFKVEKDFQMKETTGHLAQIYENFDFPTDMGILGASPEAFEMLLTQLFHLSGENLLSTNSYPASCQFLNWEYEDLEEKEVNVDQSSAYRIDTIDSKKIEASWQGNLNVASVTDDMKREASLIGNVTWDIANPMIQQRFLEISIEETQNGFLPKYEKLSAQQTWKSTSF